MVNKREVGFRIGRSSGKFDASSTVGTQAFMKAMLEAFADDDTLINQKNSQNFVDPKKLELRLSAVTASVLSEAFQYAARTLMGTQSPPERFSGRGVVNLNFGSITRGGDMTLSKSLDIKPFRGKNGLMGSSLKWLGLRTATMRMKSKSYQSGMPYDQRSRSGRSTAPSNLGRRMFIHTGKLRADILRIARSREGFSRTGLVKVVSQDASKKVLKDHKIKVRDLTVKIFPNLYAGDLPGLRSGNPLDFNPAMGFEKRIGITGDTLDKLSGRASPRTGERINRPLLQPVATYYTLFRLPSRMSAAFKKELNS